MSAGPRTVSIQQAFQHAAALQKAGQFPQAEAIYRQILAQQPDHADAIHMLGALAHQVGRSDAAVELIGKAIALQPRMAIYHMNLGVALSALNRPDDAIAAYRRADELQPGHAQTEYNLGIIFLNTGKLDEALSWLDRAVASNPEYADAHHYRGVVLGKQRRWQESASAYRRALQHRPDSAATLQQLGEALQAQEQYDQAVEFIRRSIAIEPGDSIAHNNLGHCLYNVGKLDEAIAAYQQAIAIDPKSHLALNNLGNALFHQGKGAEAIAVFEKCIAVKPDFPEGYNNFGNVLWASGRMDESSALFRKALSLRPDYLSALSNLAGNLKDTGRLAEALPYYQRIRQIAPRNSQLHSNYIYLLNHDPQAGPQRILAEQEFWDRQHAGPLAVHIRQHDNDRKPDRRLRIGYVSADFREHVVAWNLLPILEHHDHGNFEIFCFSNVISPHAMTDRIKAQADQWRTITGLDDARTADLIRQDKIDILIDLSMHSSGNRLPVFARKPAPVQITYLGYCGATGLSAMDYRLSDPFLDSKETESNYREKTIYLPHSYWCYRPGGDAPDPSAPPVLHNGWITFGCLNNFAKISLPAQELWARILSDVKDSRLLIHAQPGSHQEEFKARFAAWGIEPHRLEFIPKQSWDQYIATYHRIDIALDPFPYEGGITTCDALWMGVPVVSLVGETSLGRAGKSILSNIGRPELVAQTPEEYVQIATNLAGDRSRLKELRITLRKKVSGSSLMKPKEFTSDLEAIFHRVWRTWCAGE